MNIAIVKSAGRVLGKVGTKLQKHSPEILVIGGVVGSVASAVLACRATTKLSGILEESKEQIDQIHEYRDREDISEETYSEEDSKKDLAIVYIQSGLKIAKLYGPSILLGAASIASILGGHNIVRKRNLGLAAAYAAIDNRFKDYRNSVIERFGEEVDKELKYHLKSEKIKEEVVDEKTGKKRKVTKEVKVVDGMPKDFSEYARCFEPGCDGWEDNPEYNLNFLIAQQRWANDRLQSRGHLFLNEVYDSLGLPRTQAGQVVGWIYNPDDQKHCEQGDNYVDFGIFDVNYKPSRDFVNGFEKCIFLDFNVDGPIWDKI